MRFPLLKNSVLSAVWLLSVTAASEVVSGTICVSACSPALVSGPATVVVGGIGPAVFPAVIGQLTIEEASGLVRGSINFGSDPEVVIDATASIQDSIQGVNANLSSLSTALNGAHSRPLSRLVSTGQKTAWAAGDWGVDHHGHRNGSIGLAEFGFGYRFEAAQVNMALGKTWSSSDTVFGGEIDADGEFVLIEGIIPVTMVNGLFATLSGYYHHGELDSKRGYLNVGAADFSAASPDSRASGFRVRLDWQEAFDWQLFELSPYLDANFSHVHVDSFTETGGGFPATFASRDEANTEIRLGVNGALGLSGTSTRLLANLEIAHRFDERGVSTTGQIGGFINGFDVVASDYDQNWFKAGIGVEGNLGKGKASLMINGTTEGEMPSAWAAFAYQVRF